MRTARTPYAVIHFPPFSNVAHYRHRNWSFPIIQAREDKRQRIIFREFKSVINASNVEQNPKTSARVSGEFFSSCINHHVLNGDFFKLENRNSRSYLLFARR